MNSPSPPQPGKPNFKDLSCGCVVDMTPYEHTKDSGDPIIIPIRICDIHKSKKLTRDDVDSGIFSWFTSGNNWLYAILAIVVLAGAVFVLYYGSDMNPLKDIIKSATETVSDLKVSA